MQQAIIIYPVTPSPLERQSMVDDLAFADFVQRIRAGDGAAAAELVRQYESAIRLEVRLRLRDPALRRRFDSMDVCQSVLATFFVRAAAGQYDLDRPEGLRHLLVAIAMNKLGGQIRRHRAQRRDSRKAVPLDAGQCTVAAPGPNPSEVVAGKELLDRVRDQLSPEERQLSELRQQGHSWSAVAEMMGGTPNGRRMQFERALRRVASALGLEEEDDA
jgi:RNA polymerase sigma-70 factor (ECF subfamily)